MQLDVGEERETQKHGTLKKNLKGFFSTLSIFFCVANLPPIAKKSRHAWDLFGAHII